MAKADNFSPHMNPLPFLTVLCKERLRLLHSLLYYIYSGHLVPAVGERLEVTAFAAAYLQYAHARGEHSV